MINELWIKQGVISPGGTVISGTIDKDGHLLIATSAGIFRRLGESWSPLPNQPSVPFLQSFAYSDRFMFMGGSGLILFSTDNGKTWNRGQTAALEKPVTCLAVSPGFSQDRIVLAGTDGAGILRSTDGGKYWQYSSFGLQDFSITALVPTANWDEREVVFAATSTGLYRSPNGGRAWKSANCGLEGCVVLSIAPSPNFVEDNIVFVGTEADGIFRSSDGGFTWQRCTIAMESNARMPAINALWLSPADDTYLAGLDDGRILRSVDRGDTWVTDATSSASILCFFNQGHRIYAGTADAGLLHLADDGNTWKTATDLSARQITSLVSTANDDLFAFGATEGIWYSSDNGRSWDAIGDFESLLLTAAASDGDSRCMLAATAQGLLLADKSNPDWQLVLPMPDVTAIFFSKTFTQDRRVWVGTWSGDNFISRDGGFQWQTLAPPPTHMPVVRIGMAHSQGEPEQLISITFKPGTQTLTLWRVVEGRWQIWLESPADSPVAHIAEISSDTGEIAVSLGSRCWHWVSGMWHCILKVEKPILRLLRHPKGGLIALTADSLLYSSDFVNWTTLNQSQDEAFNDLALLPHDAERVAAHILTRGGGLVYGTIPE